MTQDVDKPELGEAGQGEAGQGSEPEERSQLELLADDSTPSDASTGRRSGRKKKSGKKPTRRARSKPKHKQPLPESAIRGISGPLDLGTDKLYFKIGEVAEIVGVPAYVLRYWETEFKAIRPQKSRSQQRVYRRRDVETLLRIKFLLYARKFTIAGARQVLKEQGADLKMAAPAGAYLARRSFAAVRSAIEDVKAEIAMDYDAETAADPSAYIRAMGGARAIFAGATQTGDAQPLLGRENRNR